MTERDITKLPKWAQERIQTLERNLAQAHKKLAEGPDNSRVFSDPYGTPRPLGWDPTILFHVDPDEPFGGKIEARIDGKGIRVMGGTRIVVFPQASNVVQIRILK